MHGLQASMAGIIPWDIEAIVLGLQPNKL